MIENLIDGIFGVGAASVILGIFIIVNVSFLVGIYRMAVRYGRNEFLYVLLSFLITPFGAAFILLCCGETEEHYVNRIKFWIAELEKTALIDRNSKPYSAPLERSDEHERYMPR